MKKIIAILLIISLVLIGCKKQTPNPQNSVSQKANDNAPVQKKKVLYVDSYHRGYEWSDDITNGVLEVFGAKLNSDDSVDDSNSKVALKIFRMNTKLNNSEEFGQQAALKAKEIIESWQPDAVITSDDNAFKYLVVPYYKDANLPFVFCGINWDVSVYGAPYKNTTGMVEVDLTLQAIKILGDYTHGTKVGYLSEDVETEQKISEIYNKMFFDGQMKTYLVKTFDEFKQRFLQLQDEVDILYIYNNSSLKDWNNTEAVEFIMKNTKVPTVAHNQWMMPYVLITLAKVPMEMGQWSANAALEILNGKKPSDISLVTNKKAKIFLNMKIAKKLEIVFPIELVNQAEFVE
jgi:hypothetical protein